MKVCKQCNKFYDKMYTNSKGSLYTNQSVLFCSKSCATTYQKGSITKTSLIEEVVKFIISENRYCTLAEILRGVGRSSKTFSKFGIKIKDIQSELGFTKEKSNFESMVFSSLKTYFTDIEREKSFFDLLSPKGFSLKFDFYIKEKNLIVEADGTQHRDRRNPWYDPYYESCDSIKDEYAKLKNINIVRIPYNKIVTDDYVKKYLANFI